MVRERTFLGSVNVQAAVHRHADSEPSLALEERDTY